MGFVSLDFDHVNEFLMFENIGFDIKLHEMDFYNSWKLENKLCEL